MEVSIIIPVYNKAEYISDCVNSLLQQDFDSFEIIAVDDGSTDNSGFICDQKATQDCHVRVIHTENRGVTAARRKGVEQSNGKYIMFVDADDQLLPGAIKKLHKAIKETNADEVIGRYTTQYGHISPIKYKGTVTDVTPLVSDIVSNRNQFPILWGLICRKEIVKDCLDIPREIIEGEDLLMQLKVLMKHPRVYFITDSVYLYNIGIPNNRKRSLEREQNYDLLLNHIIQPEWNKYKSSYIFHQIKQYEEFLIRGNYRVRKVYYGKVIPSSLPHNIPLLHRIAWRLPPYIASRVIKLYKRIILYITYSQK